MQFLVLTLTSYGGTVDHIGYFHEDLVQRERWITAAAMQIRSCRICELLPGPSGSQVSMALGLLRASWPGSTAAWAGFTYY